jgi:MFS family permease
MLLLDITVVSVALPSIQRDLRASLSDLQWVIDAYALVLGVLLLPAATLGDRLGRRRLFLAGLVIFTAGSLACALAPTALALELFRALQGVGGEVLFATGTPLLRAEFSGAALARTLGLFGATIGGATAIGPLAGGALTDSLGWRSIFFINLPIGVAAFAAGLRESRDPAGGRADWPGTALITVVLTALMFALIRVDALGWASPAIVALLSAEMAGARGRGCLGGSALRVLARVVQFGRGRLARCRGVRLPGASRRCPRPGMPGRGWRRRYRNGPRCGGLSAGLSGSCLARRRGRGPGAAPSPC